MADRKLPTLYTCTHEGKLIIASYIAGDICHTPKGAVIERWVREPATCATCKSYGDPVPHAYDKTWLIRDCDNDKGLSSPEPSDWCCHHEPRAKDNG